MDTRGLAIYFMARLVDRREDCGRPLDSEGFRDLGGVGLGLSQASWRNEAKVGVPFLD